MYVCIQCVSQVLWKSEEGLESPELELHTAVSHKVDAENPTKVLWTSGQCSFGCIPPANPLKHLVIHNF